VGPADPLVCAVPLLAFDLLSKKSNAAGQVTSLRHALSPVRYTGNQRSDRKGGNMHNMETVEAVRARYRPNRITTLFVGESAPYSGDFFYCGNTAMLRNMRRAIEAAIDGDGDFLERFKSYGWYLDDLVLTPVNQLRIRSQRKAKCFSARGSLAIRIAEYRPLAIVSLLLSIDKDIKAAAAAAGSTCPCYAVPFPGMGHQPRFFSKMARILPTLPMSGVRDRVTLAGALPG
jgi:hypothetical protein